jgi:hypothetical protein
MIPVTGKDRLTFWATLATYGVVMLFLLLGFTNTLHSRYINRKVAASLYTPKWYLYTKSPLANEHDLYKLENGTFTYVDLRPFTAAYSFGLSRRPKVLAQEIIAITADTAIMHHAQHYRVSLPARVHNISAYLPDAGNVVFTPVARRDIKQLRGKYLIAIHPPEKRNSMGKPLIADVVAVNIVDR